MIGILSYGIYVPFYRLDWEDIARAWGKKAPVGEKAVANYDEDSITMGVEAALNCLHTEDRREIDGVYFASTTAPYREKQSSSIIAAALDLRDDILTADYANSLRAGTIALGAALDTIKAGSARKILIIASDSRIGSPKSESERLFGDGAAAFLVGSGAVSVTVEGRHSISSEFMDVWRAEDDAFPRSWEDRFVKTEGYSSTIKKCIKGIMKKYDLRAENITKVVCYSPDPFSHLGITKSLGFDIKRQVQPLPFETIGNTGSAFSLMMLASALEEAGPKETILLAGYGDGCDAYILKVNQNRENAGGRKPINQQLSLKKRLPDYKKYMDLRNLFKKDTPAGASKATFLPWLWRDRKQILCLYGSRCKSCNTVFFPIQRVCDVCFKKDEFEHVRLSDRRGKVFTFNVDNLAPGEDSPVIVTIVDLEGGGRVRLEMTDRDPEEVKIGMEVELTFRRMHDSMGIHHYFWKSRPLNRRA